MVSFADCYLFWRTINNNSVFVSFHFSCVKCNAFYYDLDLLKKHVQFHPMPRQHAANSLCEICGIEYDSSSKLRQHYIRLHQPLSQIRVYECYICRVSFKCKKSLVHHMPQHTSYEKIQYECKECFLKFSRPYALRRHSLIHSNRFPFSCEYCAKPFRTRANLKVVYPFILIFLSIYSKTNANW